MLTELQQDKASSRTERRSTGESENHNVDAKASTEGNGSRESLEGSFDEVVAATDKHDVNAYRRVQLKRLSSHVNQFDRLKDATAQDLQSFAMHRLSSHMRKFNKLTAQVELDLEALGRDLVRARSLHPEQLQEVESSMRAAEELLGKLAEAKKVLESTETGFNPTPAISHEPGFFSMIFGAKPEPSTIYDTRQDMTDQRLAREVKSQKEAMLLAEEHPAATSDQRLTDTELTATMRDIYEKEYGEINTSHRQEKDQMSAPNTAPAVAAPAPATTSPAPSTTYAPGTPITWAIYDVLAYDPSTSRFDSSSVYGPVSPGERKLAFTDVLAAVAEPVKFLPHLAALRSGKVSAVAASAYVLVTRRDIERRLGAAVLPLAPGGAPPEPPADLGRAVGDRSDGGGRGGSGGGFVLRAFKALAGSVVVAASLLYLYGVVAGIAWAVRERRAWREGGRKWREVRNRRTAERRERRRKAKEAREATGAEVKLLKQE